jgi:hypothetical protein
MNNLFYELFRPWSYLTIKHEAKNKYDYLIPIILTILTAAPLVVLYLKGGVDFFSKSGLLRDFVSFLSILPGFFIAALAAIATFQKNDIDELMPVSAKLSVRMKDGRDVDVELTRRRFLCSLFSFLTAQTLLICIISLISIHSSNYLSTLFHQASVLKTIGVVGMLIFLFAFWQLMSSTAISLYYLGDRLHHPKQSGSEQSGSE